MAKLKSVFLKCLVGVFLLALCACSSMLPEGKLAIATPWNSYAEGEAMFAKIHPGYTTLAELSAHGVDPGKTPNVALLGHADFLRRLVAASSFDITSVNPELAPCLAAGQTCFAYEIEQAYSERKRVGNFWTDFFNFDRKVDVTGWQFDALVVIKGDTVIYKLWSGKPKIHQLENEKNPLGPLQGIGPSIFMR